MKQPMKTKRVRLIDLTNDELNEVATKKAINELITESIALATTWTQKKSSDYKPFKSNH